ncbi:hypothetical protein Mapa_014595 [Marchantia paleacea]|nr:hypothetical protein Mapa_014595 [Marchantia paleacea]
MYVEKVLERSNLETSDLNVGVRFAADHCGEIYCASPQATQRSNFKLEFSAMNLEFPLKRNIALRVQQSLKQQGSRF